MANAVPRRRRRVRRSQDLFRRRYELRTGQVLGPTLISRDDHGHVVRRAIVAPDFVGKRLASYRDMITSCANELIDGSPTTPTSTWCKQFTRAPAG